MRAARPREARPGIASAPADAAPWPWRSAGRCGGANLRLRGAADVPGNRAAGSISRVRIWLRACRASRLFVFLMFGDVWGCPRETIDSDRRAAIDRDLGQRGPDLIRRQPIIERAANMRGELFHLAERCDHAEIEDGTLARL